MPLIRPWLGLAALERSLWFRPALFALAAVAALAASVAIEPFVPPAWLRRFEAAALSDLLSAIASSMLAVAIFSLGTMVSAMQAAAAAATPRARPLLSADRTAQTAISTFVGAFIFSILALAGLGLNLFDRAGVAALYVLTLLLLLAVILALIAWIRRLSAMGGVSEAVALVEAAGAAAFAGCADAPHLGAEGPPAPPAGAVAIPAGRFGWVVFVDVEALGRVAKATGATLHVAVRPGAPVHPGRALLHVEGSVLPAEDAARCAEAVVIEGARGFERDPRFALIALAEIAARALSPAVNDPGTAIEALSAQTRLLAGWREAARSAAPVEPVKGVRAPALSPRELFEDAFRPIARDGAGCVEAALKLHKALGALVAIDPAAFGDVATAASAEAAARSDAAMPLAADRAAVAACRRAAGLAG